MLFLDERLIKINHFHCFDLQKENGLLSIQCELRYEGFLDKIGRGWSGDVVENDFKSEIRRFLITGLTL